MKKVKTLFNDSERKEKNAPPKIKERRDDEK